MAILHIRINEKLYKKLKEIEKKEYYESLSDCVRSAIRIGVNELEKTE